LEVLLAAGADPKKGDSFGGSAYDEAVDSKINAIRTTDHGGTLQELTSIVLLDLVLVLFEGGGGGALGSGTSPSGPGRKLDVFAGYLT